MCDWIHCNKCFLRFQPHIKFYVTTCGHMKCQVCVSKMDAENRCLVCNSVCEAALLSSKLQPDVLYFFQPAVDAIEKTNQVCEFQLRNTLSLLRSTTAKYSTAKTEIAKNYNTLQELKKEQHKLKMMIKADARLPPEGSPSINSSCDITPVPASAGSSTMTFRNASFNATPMSNASSNVFPQFGQQNPTATAWKQRQNAARMMMHRQYPGVLNASSDSSVSGPQEAFNVPGSPNTPHRHPASRNFYMGGSIPNHHGAGESRQLSRNPYLNHSMGLDRSGLSESPRGGLVSSRNAGMPHHQMGLGSKPR